MMSRPVPSYNFSAAGHERGEEPLRLTAINFWTALDVAVGARAYGYRTIRMEPTFSYGYCSLPAMDPRFRGPDGQALLAWEMRGR